MPETTATPETTGAGAVAAARASRDALKEAIAEAESAWPEDEDQDDLGEPDVSDSQSEDDEPAEAPGNSANGSELRDEIAQLKAELAELKEARTSTSRDDDEIDISDVYVEPEDDWRGMTPHARATAEKIAKANRALAEKSERLESVVGLLAFKQDFPDYKKYEGQITALLKSNKFNTGNYYEDLVMMYEHVTGGEAKKELARRATTERARSESGSLARVKPTRPNVEAPEKGKLLSFGEAYQKAVRTTVAGKARRGQ